MKERKRRSEKTFREYEREREKRDGSIWKEWMWPNKEREIKRYNGACIWIANVNICTER